VLLIGGVLAALASISAALVLSGLLGSSSAPVVFGPSAITVDPNASPAPLRKSRQTRPPGCWPVPAILPHRCRAQSRRAAGRDVTSLQLSLERYRAAWGGIECPRRAVP